MIDRAHRPSTMRFDEKCELNDHVKKMTTMAASPTLVIAAGPAITTWECLSEDKSFTFYPQGDFHVADIAWNHNGQVLASCSRVSTDEKLHDNVVLTAAQSGAKLDSLQHDQDWKRPAGTTTSVAFGGKSRYLCLGDSSGAVCLWDLKKRLRVRQFFHDGYPSRQVSLDPTDKYVVSLSDRLLSIYNLREGTLAMTLSPPGSFSFTRFHISPMEPNVAAVGTTDGSILLYDITDKESPTPFFALNRRHAGAITGLAISPQNAQLLAATSDDGTLMFFDRQSGETIHQLAALASPITCMSLHYDGMSCAVGTESGEVFMYDLRENTPLSSLRVKYAVSSIQFAPPPKNADQNNQTKSEPSSTKKQTTPRYDQSDDTYQESRQSDGGGREAPPSSITNNNTKPTSPQKSSAQKSIATFGTQGNTSQATFGTQNALPSQVASQSSFGTQNAQPSIMPAGFRGLLSDIEQRIPRENHAATPPENPPTPREYQAPIPREHHAPAPREYHVPAPVHQIQPGTTTEPSIKVGDIREVVRNEVDSLRDDMEEAIRNLHMDMLSQFHQQSQEINNTLASQQESIARMTEENGRLREENEYYKAQQDRKPM